MNHEKILLNRYKNEGKSRRNIWRFLCEYYFQKFVKRTDTIIDIGAGHCEFINNIKGKVKIALDISPDFKKYAEKDVATIVSPANKIPKKLYGKANVVFMSNFLEHLPDKKSVLEIFEISNKLLVKGGKLIILQPNIDLAHEKYWDWIDHSVALNGRSLREAANASNFKVSVFIKRFLPLTAENNFPKPIWIIRAYLSLPSFLRFYAGQSLFVAVKE